jgi:sarcosine oxidase subunit gamma
VADAPLLTAASPIAPAAGRSGRLDGASGVTARIRTDLQIASVIARPGGERALAERLGFEPPAEPQRRGAGGLALLGVGPHRWLAVAEGGEALADRLARELAGAASVCDQSDGYFVIELGGPAARRALAKGVAIDLHPSAFPADAVAVTQVAHIGVVIWRTDVGERFRLALFRSMAASFWGWLSHASAEFGLTTEASE